MQFYSLAGAIIFPLLFLVMVDAGFVPSWLQTQIAGLVALGGPITLTFFLLLFMVIGAKVGQKIFTIKNNKA